MWIAEAGHRLGAKKVNKSLRYSSSVQISRTTSMDSATRDFESATHFFPDFCVCVYVNLFFPV